MFTWFYPSSINIKFIIKASVLNLGHVQMAVKGPKRTKMTHPEDVLKFKGPVTVTKWANGGQVSF